MKTFMIETVVIEHNKYLHTVEADTMEDAIAAFHMGVVEEAANVVCGVGGSGHVLTLSVVEEGCYE